MVRLELSLDDSSQRWQPGRGKGQEQKRAQWALWGNLDHFEVDCQIDGELLLVGFVFVLIISVLIFEVKTG